MNDSSAGMRALLYTSELTDISSLYMCVRVRELDAVPWKILLLQARLSVALKCINSMQHTLRIIFHRYTKVSGRNNIFFYYVNVSNFSLER